MGTQAVGIARKLAIEDRLRSSREYRVIYNGSFEEPVRGQYDGKRYIIPPDGETLEHCAQDPQLAVTTVVEKRGEGNGEIRVFDGTLHVFDVYDAPKDLWREYRKNKKTGRNVKPPTPTELKTRANSIVAHLVANHEHRGICLLIGDPAVDGPAKAQARQRWIAYDQARCERIVSSFREADARFKSNPSNAGSRFRPMTAIERRAQEKLDMYQVGLDVPDREMCPVECGYWTDGENAKKALKIHLAARHPGFKAPEPEPQASAPQPPVQVTPNDEDAEAEDRPARRRKTA